MANEACAQHPDTAANYACQGCERNLCEDCVDSGHALLICRICGEQALPLNQEQPATARERSRRDAVTKPYSFQEALMYPFRGMGLFLFVAAVICMLLLQLLRLGMGSALFTGGFWTLMVGLQFKIIRSTAEGANELPDWPDYMDWTERIMDVLAYAVIMVLQFGPLALYVYMFRGSLFTTDPSLLFWAGFSIVAWAGTGLSVIAYGAAGRFDRFDALRFIQHGRAFAHCGADAIAAANMVFGFGILVFILRTVFSAVPFFGAIISSCMAAYWFFTSAHLSGVVMRRHIYAMEEMYP